MSEPVWTTISIGGAMPRDGVDHLAEAYADDMNEPDTADVAAAVADAIEAGKPLHLAGMCNFGQPDMVSGLCRELGLPYSIHFEGYGADWSTSCAYWEPGRDRETECAASNDGEPVISVRAIRAALADGTLAAVLDEAEKIAGEHLPPLTWAEDSAEA